MKAEFFNGAGGGGSVVPNPKVYQSVLTQSGVGDAPTEVVLRNDFGSAMSFTWSYLGVGDYKATGIYNFIQTPSILDKIVFFSSNMGFQPFRFMSLSFIFTNPPPTLKDIRIVQEVAGGGRINTLVNTRFEIRIYH